MCLIKYIKNLFIVWGVDFKVGNFASQIIRNDIPLESLFCMNKPKALKEQKYK